MATPQQLIARARSFPSLGAVLAGGFGATILAVFYQGIELLQAIVGVLLFPLEALGVNAAQIVSSFVGGIADIIQQGAITTQQAIAPGASWAVGPLTFFFAILAAGAGLVAMAFVLSLSPTSDALPGTFTDVPFIGVNENEEDFGDE